MTNYETMPDDELVAAMHAIQAEHSRRTVIQSPTMMTLTSTNAFTGTTCNIYVPDALVAAYQAATNWSTLAARIKPISELP